MASNFRLDELIRRYPSWETESSEIEYQSKQPCWDATPTQRVRGGTRIEASFAIHSCPKFRRETR